MRGLKGKRILVAGAGGGIGRSLSIRLAEEGVHVLIAGFTAAKLPESARLAEAAAAATGNGGKVATQLFDIMSHDSINQLVNACAEKLGGLDGIAIPAADVSLDTMHEDAPVPNAEIDLWNRVLHANLIAQMQLIQAALPLIKKAGRGSIVTLSSNSAYLGRGTVPAYAASKAGLEALTRHVARVGGVDNIRCNGVSPGLATDPDRVLPANADVENLLNAQAIKRLGRYSDIAAMIAFLLSDDAEWITGQIISVNGGMAFRD